MDATERPAHTPGPWKPRGSHLALDFGIVVEDKYVIAEVFSDIRQAAHIDIEEARANARLIAAAPDLLAALTDCVTAMTALHCGKESRDSIIEAARAAISRATTSTGA